MKCCNASRMSMSCTFAPNSVRVRVGENRNCIIASRQRIPMPRSDTQTAQLASDSIQPTAHARSASSSRYPGEDRKRGRLRTGKVVELASGRLVSIQME